jgi:glutathione S-transferase
MDGGADRQKDRDGSGPCRSAWLLVGSNQVTSEQIGEFFRETLAILEPHFARHINLFGQYPAFADFALWGQRYNARTDPTQGHAH